MKQKHGYLLGIAAAVTACEWVAGISERDSLDTDTATDTEELEPQQRACSVDLELAARFGPCALGEQQREGDGWSACSVAPAPADTCEPGNDDNCDGRPNQGCECLIGDAPRSCENDFALPERFGACSVGQEVCIDGYWGKCSVLAAAKDGCTDGDDSNCNGVPNEGCPCVEGEVKACGDCGDGTTVCSGGARTPCQGASSQRIYYLDRDGDGHGDPERFAAFCSAPGPDYVSTPDDCCDLDAKAFLGQTMSNGTPRELCGGYDFDCDGTETKGSTRTSCASSSAMLTEICAGYWEGEVPECGADGNWVSLIGLRFGGEVTNTRSTQVCR